MTKENKILLGIGAVVIAYYLYTTNKNKAVANQQPTTPTPPNTEGTPKVYYCKDGFKKTIIDNPNIQNIRYANPCEGHGGIDEIKTNGGGNAISDPIAGVETFEFIKDFQSNPNQATTRMISWDFKKGQKIRGIPDYSKCAIGGGVCPVLTTTKGELQGKQNQMYWITIPQGFLKVSK